MKTAAPTSFGVALRVAPRVAPAAVFGVALAVALAVAVAPTTAAADTLVVLNKNDATATLIDPDTRRALATLPTGVGPHEVAVSPDGATAVVANYGRREPGNTLTVIDLVGRRVVATIDLGDHRRPHGIHYLPDGNCVLVTTEDFASGLQGEALKVKESERSRFNKDSQSVLVVHVKRRAVIAAVDTRARVSHMIAVTRDGRRAFTANIGSGDVSVIDVRRRAFERRIAIGAGAEGIALTPDGRELWVANRAADTISVIDTASHAVVATLPSASFPIRVAMTPDGKHALVSNARSSTLSVFDVANHNLARTIRVASTPIGILVDPAGSRAYIANTDADAISVLDLATWQIDGVMTAGDTPDGMAYARTPAPPRRFSRPRKQILDAFRGARADLRRCYTDNLNRQPDRSGRVVVKFTIAPAGTVSTAAIVQTNLAAPAVESCIKRRVGHFRFPPPPPPSPSAIPSSSSPA